jgi:drug/metabolite transporter (DMT)-like permease
MVEDPMTLIAVLVMIFSHVWMAILARDDTRAKGFEALLFLCFPPYALFYYMRMPKRKRKRSRIDCLHWIFLASTTVVIFRVF